MGEWFKPPVLKTGTPKAAISVKSPANGVAGSNPAFSSKLFELYAFSLVLSRLVPIRRFTFGTNARLALGAFARYPLMIAATALVALKFNGDQCHDLNNRLAKDTLSREIENS